MPLPLPCVDPTQLPLAASWWLPVDRSLHGQSIDTLFHWIFWVCILVFFIVHALILLAIHRYRATRQTPVLHTHGNARLEILWTVIPALILGAMAVASLRVSRSSAFANTAGPLTDEPVQRFVVIAQQFKWNVIGAGPDGAPGAYLIYPRATDPTWPIDATGRATPFRGATGPAFLDARDVDDALAAYTQQVNPIGKVFDTTLDPAGADDDWRGALGRDLVVKVNRPVEIRVLSRDVIHGFFLPDFRVKLNAIPGRAGVVRFTPTTPGTYDIVCSNYCGLGHAAMGARLVVEPE